MDNHRDNNKRVYLHKDGYWYFWDKRFLEKSRPYTNEGAARAAMDAFDGHADLRELEHEEDEDTT